MFKMFASEMLSLFWLRAWLCHLHLSPVHFQLFRKYVLPVNLKHFLNCGHRKGACRVFLGVDYFQNLAFFCSFLCNTGILHTFIEKSNGCKFTSHFRRHGRRPLFEHNIHSFIFLFFSLCRRQETWRWLETCREPGNTASGLWASTWPRWSFFFWLSLVL